MPLTDTQIRTAKPESKARRLYDSGGLYIEISPKGHKWWRLKYRYNGKEKRLALGVYPDVSLKMARAKRDEARRLLGNGIDPSQHRKASRAETEAQSINSFENIGREWFAKFSASWSESHGTRIIRRLERDIFPWLGGTPIAEIKAIQLLSALRRIEDRGAVETAHRALQNTSQVFRYAVATGRAERDPSTDLRGALAPVQATHFPAVTEPARAGEILAILNNYQGTLPVKCALRLAPLVFVRPGELRHARWKEIDLNTAEWRFVVTKTQSEHIVPLSRQAIEVLQELHPLTGHGEFVFPSARSRKGDRPMSDNAVLAAMRRMGIEKDEMTGHGFRAMARTILDEVLNFRPELIEHQLAHSVRDPLGRAYNRTAHLPERKRMMQEWADYLDLLQSGGPT